MRRCAVQIDQSRPGLAAARKCQSTPISRPRKNNKYLIIFLMSLQLINKIGFNLSGAMNGLFQFKKTKSSAFVQWRQFIVHFPLPTAHCSIIRPRQRGKGSITRRKTEFLLSAKGFNNWSNLKFNLTLEICYNYFYIFIVLFFFDSWTLTSPTLRQWNVDHWTSSSRCWYRN